MNGPEPLPWIALPDYLDIDVERTEWTPTPRQFARYLKREVELAKANFALVKNSADTLHSKEVLFAAVQSK